MFEINIYLSRQIELPSTLIFLQYIQRQPSRTQFFYKCKTVNEKYRDIYIAENAPGEIEFGHARETPDEWEQRFEKINDNTHSRQGKVVAQTICLVSYRFLLFTWLIGFRLLEKWNKIDLAMYRLLLITPHNFNTKPLRKKYCLPIVIYIFSLKFQRHLDIFFFVLALTSLTYLKHCRVSNTYQQGISTTQLHAF